MKRTMTACAWILCFVCAIGIITSCSDRPRLSLSASGTTLFKTCCCETTQCITGQLLSSPTAPNNKTVTQVLGPHALLAYASLDTCPCGPDTTLTRVVGADSMRITKSGSWLTAYFSAPTPIFDSLRVGNYYIVYFRKT